MCSRSAPAGSSSRRWAAARTPTLRMVSWLATRIGIALGAFLLASAAAELFGATNLGTAFGVGQVVFALTVASLLITTGGAGVRRRPPPVCRCVGRLPRLAARHLHLGR